MSTLKHWPFTFIGQWSSIFILLILNCCLNLCFVLIWYFDFLNVAVFFCFNILSFLITKKKKEKVLWHLENDISLIFISYNMIWRCLSYAIVSILNEIYMFLYTFLSSSSLVFGQLEYIRIFTFFTFFQINYDAAFLLNNRQLLHHSSLIQNFFFNFEFHFFFLVTILKFKT